MVAFRPISYNLWRTIFPWAPSIRDEGHCPHAAMVSQLPPPDPRIRASDISYVPTMGEGPEGLFHAFRRMRKGISLLFLTFFNHEK